ncbi:MAG: hypothetical protein IJR02_07290 [Bacteroidaceae bacterium]|nr:hypothetical protein [Bacteroidaceae bacterium]
MKKTYDKPSIAVFYVAVNNILQYSVKKYRDGGSTTVGGDEDEEEETSPKNSIWGN